MVSSVGLKCFNLLGSSSSSREGMSSLGYVISFSRYLVLKLVIAALTVGICRTVCKMLLITLFALVFVMYFVFLFPPCRKFNSSTDD